MKLDSLIEKMRTEGKVMKASELPPTQRLPAGNLSLDYLLNGGWVRGAIHLLSGPEGSGKTSLACVAIHEVLRQSPSARAFIVDVEGAWFKEQMERWRLDMERVAVAKGFASLEEAYDALVAAVGQYDIVVLDSLTAVATEAEATASVKERSYAPGAREANALLRRLVARLNSPAVRDSGTLSVIIVISQVRDVISGAGVGGISYTPVGGHGIRHLAHVWIDCRVKERVKDSDGKIVALELSLRTIKNKTGPNFRAASVLLVIRPYHTLEPPAFDPYWDLLVWGELTGVLKRAGGWYQVVGEELRWQGMAGAYRLGLETVERLRQKAREVILSRQDW